MRIGFVGLGRMGAGMARSLIRAGQDLIVWNRSPAPAEELVREGARRARGLSEVFESDAVITMLATDAAIRETLLGQGIIDRARPGTLHIVSATISVPFAQELERIHHARGLGYVSAPVLGRPDVAAAGELNLLVAGERGAVERATPILNMFAKKVWPFGEKAAMANVAKLATNFALGCAIETMSETCALARRNEIDPDALIELFTGTLFAAPAYKLYGPVVANQTFEPTGFLLTHGFKDIRQAMEAGELSNVPLPFASVLRDNFVDALAHGDAEKDWAAISAVALRRAGF